MNINILSLLIKKELTSRHIMYRLIFSKESETKIKSIISQYPLHPPNSLIELEYRIQPVDDKIPISKTLFDNVQLHCQRQATSIAKQTSITENKGVFRYIRELETNKEEFQKKKRIFKEDIEIVESILPFDEKQYIKTLNLRLASAIETPIAKQQYLEEKGVIFTRKRERTTYHFSEYQLDTTVITSNEHISYEIEVEFLNPKSFFNGENGFILFMKTLKSSLLMLFPKNHTIYDKSYLFDEIISNNEIQHWNQYKTLFPIPTEKRPVNIQDSYMNLDLLSYAVTNKLDGVGYFVYVRKDGKILLINNTEIWFLFAIKKIDRDLIFKAEIMVKDEICKIVLFDVAYQSNDSEMFHRPLEERLNVVMNFKNTIKNRLFTKFEVKKFEFNRTNTKEDLQRCITKTVKRMTEEFGLLHIEENNDGLIFEPMTNKRLPILKWKFPGKVTIDFKLESIPQNKNNSYYCYINRYINNRPSLVRFQIDNKDAIATFDEMKSSSLHNKIVELGYNKDTKKFIFHRIREDKTMPNAEKVSIETFRDMVNILTLPKLMKNIENIENIKNKEPMLGNTARLSLCKKIADKEPGQVEIKKERSAYQNEANEIKRELIQQWCKQKTVLDIGSGKGGDFSKYKDVSIKQLYAVEPSLEHMTISKERGYKMLPGKVVFIDTTGQDTSKITNILRGQKVNVITAMFSLTYSFKTEQSLNQLVSTMTQTLSPTAGSSIIGTVMDGYSTMNMLVSKGGKFASSTILLKLNPPEQGYPYGQSLYTNIEGSKTALNLNEYLFFIDELSNRLEVYGIFLTRYVPFVASDQQPKDDADIFSLYASFVYERGTLLTSFNTPIKHLGQLYRMPTVGDGSCLFHAVSAGILGPSYTPEKGLRLRKEVSKTLTLTMYEKIQKSNFAMFRLEIALHENMNLILKKIQDCNQEHLDVDPLLREYKPKYSHLSLSEFLLQLPYSSEVNEMLVGIHLIEYEKTKRSLLNCSEWAEDWAYDLLQHVLGMNILIWYYEIDRSNKVIRNKFIREKEIPLYSYPETVLICNLNQGHFENIRFAGNDRSVISTEIALEILEEQI